MYKLELLTVLNYFYKSSLQFFFYAGLYYVLFYIVFRKSVRKIQTGSPSKWDIIRDSLHSVSSLLIFALLYTSYAEFYQHTKLYLDVNDYPMWWTILSFFLLVIFYDTYFYWTHWLMHKKWLFPYIHETHHRSKNPTSVTSYSFHPIEAIIQYVWIIPVVFLVPLHGIVLYYFGLFVLFVNIAGHGGMDLFPPKFKDGKIGRWFNTGIYHNLHHKNTKGNYGIFFTFWDRMMGTLRDETDLNNKSQNEKK